jgi:hypothetical protein
VRQVADGIQIAVIPLLVADGQIDADVSSVGKL